MKRTTISFLVLMIIGALVIIASIELNAQESDSSDVQEHKSVVVLELFTSQGCSSCPPADQLLKRVDRESGTSVIPLSYHVDYWNYIGWKDPFSNPEYTERQSNYNRKFGSRSNYTPQLVVNGKEHLVGSNASKLYTRISSYSKLRPENTISVSEIRKAADRVDFKYQVKGPTKGKNIRAILVIDQRDTFVKRGENQNRKLSNSHIVVFEKKQELVADQGSLNLLIPNLVRKEDKLRVVVLVENDDLDITAGARSVSF